MGQRSDIPLPIDPYRFTVVLVGTSHAGNLGAVCRGMLNHGFDRLRLVHPQCDIDDERGTERNMRVVSSTMPRSTARLTRPCRTPPWWWARPASGSLGGKRCFATSCTHGTSPTELEGAKGTLRSCLARKERASRMMTWNAVMCWPPFQPGKVIRLQTSAMPSRSFSTNSIGHGCSNDRGKIQPCPTSFRLKSGPIHRSGKRFETASNNSLRSFLVSKNDASAFVKP